MRLLETLTAPFVKLADLLAAMDAKRREIWARSDERQASRKEKFAVQRNRAREHNAAARASLKAETHERKRRRQATKDWRRIIKDGKL